MVRVRALPNESPMTLGGAPRRKLRCRKSLSLETIRNLGFGKLPNRFIGPARQIERMHMFAAGKVWRQNARQERAQILIEQQLHSPKELSCRQAPFAGGGKGQRGPQVLRAQRRELVEQLDFSHAASQVIQHIIHGDARTDEAWLPVADGRVDGDVLVKVHDSE